MVPYENWHVLTLYDAKQGLPKVYAENDPPPPSIQVLSYASLQIGEDIS
jgi:hypothetical protein